MEKFDRSKPMPVKYWSFAGLCITDWCNASCACCYMRCSPQQATHMAAETAVRIWRELQNACPHGCRIHLSGGEAFGDYDKLLAIARAAQAEGLGPLQKVETNGFWATNDEIIRQRLAELDKAGMEKLAVSCDPFHQEFVPLEHVRRLVRLATEMLGPDRLQVRWEDWLAEGCDTNTLPESKRMACFAQWIAAGRDRLNGRAAELLAESLPLHPVETFADQSCKEGLLRGRHVHVNPDGSITPGVCAGIVLGVAGQPDGLNIAELWQALNSDHSQRPIVGSLARGGPVALLPLAQKVGFVANPAGYASKCHLCWCIRAYLADKKMYPNELGPKSLYENGSTM